MKTSQTLMIMGSALAMSSLFSYLRVNAISKAKDQIIEIEKVKNGIKIQTIIAASLFGCSLFLSLKTSNK